MPLYVRENTILAVGADNTRPDYDYSTGTTLRIYQLADGVTASCELHDAKGKRIAKVTATRKCDKVNITVEGKLKDATVEVVGSASAKLPDGAMSFELKA